MHRRFGVEQEQFILHEDGTPPSHDEMDRLYELLQKQSYGVCAADARGRVLAVERSTESGSLVVTNDCYTHVLEVAFPPFDNLDVFRRVALEEFSLIGAALQELGLAVRPGAALNPPHEMSARPKATDPNGARLNAVLTRAAIDHPLFHPALPACIAATQVSLNIPDAEAIRKLSSFYQFEPLIPLLFGNSPEFNGVRGWCVRPLAWMANFPSSYSLLGVPDPVPGSLSEYEQMRQSSKSRDYSFVSIRSADRVEFRSACSQDSLDDILWLIRFRLAVDRACERDTSPPRDNPRARFIAVCTTGPGPWCEELFQRLFEVDPSLQELWRKRISGEPGGVSPRTP